MKKLLSILFSLFLFGTAHAITFTVPNLSVQGSSNLSYPAIVAGGCQNIAAYGGSTGAADNSAALLAAIAAAPTNNKCVAIGPGTWNFSANVSYTLPNVSGDSLTILGAGQDVTNLNWSAAGGLTINFSNVYNSLHIRDLSLLTGSVNTGTALTVNMTAATSTNGANNAPSDITNVTVRGADGYAVNDYWSTGIIIYGASVFNFYNTNIIGGGGCTSVSGGCYTTNTAIGVNIAGTSSLIPVQFNFVSCLFNYIGTGILYGNYAQGIIVMNSEFVGGTFGIHSPASETGLDQLTIIGSNFNVSTIPIITETAIPGMSVIGNYILVPANTTLNSGNAVGIQITNGVSYSIVGNVIQGITGSPSGNNGIVSDGATAKGIISGNSITDLALGVWLKTASTGINVQSNVYNNNTTNINNAGTGNTIGGGSP